MKKVLITGAAGFLGSHLCDRFISEGFSVIGMDNFITGDPKNIQHLFDSSNFKFIEHDVTEFVKIEGNLDYILHFASPASPIDYLKIPIQTLKVGSLGTHNLLGLAKAKKARILRYMEILLFILKPKITMATLIPLGQEAFMMKQNVFKSQLQWLIIDFMVWKLELCEYLIHMAPE